MKKRKVLRRIIIFIVVTVVISIVCTCFFTAKGVFAGSMQLVDNQLTSLESGRKSLAAAHFDLENLQNKYCIEEVQIKSTDANHSIPASYITIGGIRDNNTVILVHGLGGNRFSVYPIAEKFLENGFNVIAYDQRSSGENQAQYTTFGYLESRDLNDYINYVDSTIGKDKKIVLWGTSFGGATVGIAMGGAIAKKRVAGAILDSPLSSMRDMIKSSMMQMDKNLPVDFMLFMGNVATKIKLGFSYNDADVCNYVSLSDIPLLVINSRADKITPYYMGENIFKAAKNPIKEMYTVEDSAHAKIFRDYKDEYVARMMKFIWALK